MGAAERRAVDEVMASGELSGFLGAPGVAINIAASAPVQVHVSNCTLFGNNGGVSATVDQTPNVVHLDRVRVNGTNTAIQADGNAAVFVSNSAIAGNNVGFNPLNKGQITSFGNNVLAGNAKDGKPTATLQGQAGWGASLAAVAAARG